MDDTFAEDDRTQGSSIAAAVSALRMSCSRSLGLSWKKLRLGPKSSPYRIAGLVDFFRPHPDAKFASDLVVRVNLRQKFADLRHRTAGEGRDH
jgi:hypothetical protein